MKTTTKTDLLELLKSVSKLLLILFIGFLMCLTMYQRVQLEDYKHDMRILEQVNRGEKEGCDAIHTLRTTDIGKY